MSRFGGDATVYWNTHYPSPPQMFFVLGCDNTYTLQIMDEQGGPVKPDDVSFVSAKIVKVGDPNTYYEAEVTLATNENGHLFAHALFPKTVFYDLLFVGNVLHLQWRIKLANGIEYVAPIPPQVLVVIEPIGGVIEYG